jgi:hypothetical protein
MRRVKKMKKSPILVEIRRLAKPDNNISYDLESFSSAKKTENSR